MESAESAVEDEDDEDTLYLSHYEEASIQEHDNNDRGGYVGLFNVDPVQCPICFSRADSGTALTLPNCGHSVCIECFRLHIKRQEEQGRANNITCYMPEAECCQPVGQNVLDEVLEEQDLARLKRLSLSAMVDTNRDYHFCPTPDCLNVLHWKGENGPPIGYCFKCGRQSCLECHASPYHAGLTCGALWRQHIYLEEAQRLAAYYSYSQYLESQRPAPCSIIHPEVDRSRAGEELRYDDYHQSTDVSLADLDIRVCRRCGSWIELTSGCLKTKCRCGYRFCFRCGVRERAV